MHLFRRRKYEEPSDTEDLHLVVGLGNPGGKYADTRHNVGFAIAERLADENGISIRSSKQRAETGRGKVGNVPAVIALPVTYMNESGNAVSRLLAYYHIPVERLLVIADEMDLPFGTLRMRPRGSAAGHNGLRSIEQAIGTDDFARLRFGIGRPAARHGVPHVLGRFSEQETERLPDLVETAARAVAAALNEGLEKAMNEFNRSWEDSASNPPPAASPGERETQTP